MPIYEYECVVCGAHFELLIKVAGEAAAPRCPQCGSGDARKRWSSFAVGAGKTETCPSPTPHACPTNAPCHEHCPWEKR